MKKKITLLILLALFGLSGILNAQIPTNGLIAWYPFSGDANDWSGNGRNLTVVGSTLTTDRFNNANAAYFFNGTGNYMYRTQNLGNTDFTWSVWVYSNVNTGQRVMINNGPPQGCTLYAGNTNFVVTVCCQSIKDNVTNSTYSLPMNTWTHIVLTRSGNLFTVYINGVQNSSGSSTMNSPIGNFEVGAGNASQFFSGKLDDIRLYNRALNTSEITALYNETPTNNGLVAWYPFTGNANDWSGSGYHGSVNGAILTTDRFTMPNCAYYFDGVNDNIIVPNFNVNFNQFSISAWYCTSDPSRGQQIVDQSWCNTPGPGSFNLAYDLNAGNWGPVICMRSSSNSYYYCRPNITSTINTWYHLVATFDNSNLKLYRNGALVTTTPAAVNLFQCNYTLYLGGGYWFFYGKIDDIRIYNRALTTTEINTLYNEPVNISNNNSNEIRILLYPNPATDKITIENKSENEISAHLYNIKGELILSNTLNNSSKEIDISSFAKGIYFVKIQTGETIITKKLLIQ